MYAIVDIETTGGQAATNGITEIAIYVHDGQCIVKEFSTLINPLVTIPPFLESYTGITNEMVSRAPKFEDVAEQIFNLLKDSVFVAHNVNFDYSFIHYQLLQCGYTLPAKKLCTVRLSRKIFPGYKSYSLGNICTSLNIPISDRHRASGDALATVKLFEKILATDDGSVINGFLKPVTKKYTLPPNLPQEQLEKLTQQIGVYYFYNNEKQVVFIGKAKNIKKQVTSHFTGNKTNKQKQELLNSVCQISTIECSTELIASILEFIELKKYKPIGNRVSKKAEFAFGIYDYQDRNDYVRLAIDKVRKNIVPLQTYKTQIDAETALQEIITAYTLCPRLCVTNTLNLQNISFKSLCCNGPCEQKENAIDYNKRITKAISSITQYESYAIIDKGRYADEISCILIENGKFYGMGYVPIDQQIADISLVKSMITAYKESFYIKELLQFEYHTYSAKIVKFENIGT